MKLAVASSSRNAPLIIERLALAPLLDAVVDGGMVSRSKPDPEVFLKAAAALGLPPARCAVVEDAQSGLEAARPRRLLRGGVQPARSAAGRRHTENLQLPALAGPL